MLWKPGTEILRWRWIESIQMLRVNLNISHSESYEIYCEVYKLLILNSHRVNEIRGYLPLQLLPHIVRHSCGRALEACAQLKQLNSRPVLCSTHWISPLLCREICQWTKTHFVILSARSAVFPVKVFFITVLNIFSPKWSASASEQAARKGAVLEVSDRRRDKETDLFTEQGCSSLSGLPIRVEPGMGVSGRSNRKEKRDVHVETLDEPGMKQQQVRSHG